jgi:tripartite-type tricarboxylate transporter receptor subunit TctC
MCGKLVRRFLLFIPVLCAAAFTAGAAAQSYPARPIKYIVSYPAGGSADLISRVTAKRMSEGLGQQIVVENRAGASGTIGVDAIAKAPADGYTIGLGTVTTLAMAPSVQRNLPYDPLKALAPISLIADAPLLVVVHPSVSARSLGELIDLAKASPGKLNFASIGSGSLLHFAGEQFKALAGVNLVHVPYKGVAPATLDLMSGQVQIMFDQLASFRAQNIESGKLRALAVAGPARLTQLPAVPTTAEAGLPGFDVAAWFGVVAPRGAPAEAIERLAAEVQKAVASQEVREILFVQGLNAVSSSPQQFQALIQNDIAKWAGIVKVSGFKPD